MRRGLERIARAETAVKRVTTPVLPDVPLEYRPEAFYDANFPEQRAAIEDTAALITVLTTRRSGKSFGVGGLRLMRAMFRWPGCSVLFIALTKDSAKGILWKDVLKVIDRKWNLGARFNEAELTMTLPNGSICYLMGADADEGQREKLLGRKYAEVCCDEAASFSIDLNDLVYSVLKPAVADYEGTITLIGTPGNLKHGLFFELTKEIDPRKPARWTRQGWSGHCWDTFKNPHMREKWQREIDQLIAGNPLIQETPAFQQNYWGIWVIDSTKLVYRYASPRNDYATLPSFRTGEWHFTLAIDLGFGWSAFTVLQYHDESDTLYVPLSFKKAGLDITDTAKQAAELRSRYPIETTVIDGANKQAVEELNNRHGTEAVAADKTGKFDFIDIMNAEFIQARIRLGPDTQDLKDEYAGLIVDERKLKKGVRDEHPGCANHCADTGLYGWRWCWQYLYVEPSPPGPKPGTVAHAEQQPAAALKDMEEQFEKQLSDNTRQQHEQQERDLYG